MRGDETQVEIVFWSIQRADFGVYYLMAENGIGSDEVPIVLHPAYDSAHPWPAPASRMEQLKQLYAESSDCKFVVQSPFVSGICEFALWHSGNTLNSIDIVTLHWARLVPGWVTILGWENSQNTPTQNQAPRSTEPSLHG